MKIKIEELIDIQQKVNDKVAENTDYNITMKDYILAFNVELFEFFNEVGIWKWWKHGHIVKRERVLDELADCFAFFLSMLCKVKSIKNVDKLLNDYFGLLVDFEKNSETKENPNDMIKDLITYIGTDNETEEPINTMNRFVISIFITTLLFPGITWEEITEAYKKKSRINIERQEKKY